MAKAKSTKKAQSNPLKQNSLPNWIVLLVILVPVAVVSYLYMSGQVLRPQDLLGAASVAEAESGSTESGGYSTIWQDRLGTNVQACTYFNKNNSTYGLTVKGTNRNSRPVNALEIYKNNTYIGPYSWSGSNARYTVRNSPGTISFKYTRSGSTETSSWGYFEIRAC